MTTRLRRTLQTAAFCGLTSLALGCGDAGPGVPRDIIAPEEFVAVYVDLRVAALRSSTGEIDPSERDRILSAAGVTQDDLLRFVETLGQDAVFMRGVWDSVEVAYQRVREAEMEARDAEMEASGAARSSS